MRQPGLKYVLMLNNEKWRDIVSSSKSYEDIGH